MVACRYIIVLAIIALTSIGYLYYTNVYTIPTATATSSRFRLSAAERYHYRNISFDKNNGDVFSFIHIQKTGGTSMEKHLIHNINNSNCKCAKTKKPLCMCYRDDIPEIWLVCRYIQPKWPCGLHPDYATLYDCTPRFMENLYGYRRRRYFYGTLIRNPLHRFLSEFRHVQRGASWEAAASICKGQLLMNETPQCFEGAIWTNLTIDKFLSCPYNLAINRQTWMLSNISAVSCEFDALMMRSGYRRKLLVIAKRNLVKLAYFGLLEYPVESQFIFEKTFGMEFIEPFQRWDTGFAREYLKASPLPDSAMKKIITLNSLDFELYKFAKSIFFERFDYFKRIHGSPRKQTKPAKSKFDMGKGKLARLQSNLPRSKAKEKKMKERKEKEMKRERGHRDWGGKGTSGWRDSDMKMKRLFPHRRDANSYSA